MDAEHPGHRENVIDLGDQAIAGNPLARVMPVIHRANPAARGM